MDNIPYVTDTFSSFRQFSDIYSVQIQKNIFISVNLKLICGGPFHYLTYTVFQRWSSIQVFIFMSTLFSCLHVYFTWTYEQCYFNTFIDFYTFSQHSVQVKNNCASLEFSQNHMVHFLCHLKPSYLPYNLGTYKTAMTIMRAHNFDTKVFTPNYNTQTYLNNIENYLQQCIPLSFSGSEDLQCDTIGRCTCKEGVTGDKCDRCKPNYYDFGQLGCKYVFYVYSVIGNYVSRFMSTKINVAVPRNKQKTKIWLRKKKHSPL